MANSTKASKARTKKGRKNTRSHRDFWSPMHWLKKAVSLLLRPLAFKVYLVLATLLTAYIVYLDATITSSFEGKKWQLPARVYARPLELFEGLTISANELEQELKDLGYREGSSTRAGSYYRSGNKITLHSRGHIFWDGIEASQQARVTFEGNELTELSELNNTALAILRLEPMEIGAIYPNHREDRVLVNIQEVPPLLVAALLAVEDHRFYEHKGVSPSAIARAALQNIKSGSVVQGGSTITQQLVKNYYLSRERSISRKVTEALMSLLLEFHYEKEAILQAYLNEVYLGQAGNRGIHGFGLASQHYFNRPLTELSIDRLALLIAIVRGPTYYDPWRYPERAIERRNRVLDILVMRGLLEQVDAQWAKEQPLNLGKQSRSHYVFPAYIDLVKRQLREVYHNSDLTSNGLKIYTSFDPRIQRHAEQAIIQGLNAREDKKLQAAMVVTQPETGEVLAVVGGSKPRYSGFNRALDAKRSIGSVVKPVVYLTALSKPKQYNLATMIDDSPITIETDGKQWSPRNYDRKDHGKVPLIVAMAKSYNQAAARVGNQVGVDAVADVMQQLGLAREVNRVPSLFIGTTQLSPFEVTGLYQTIAANGYRTPLKAIRAVLDSNNLPLERFQYRLEQEVEPDAVHLLQRAMIQVGRDGSARSARRKLGNEFIFAGKTGTSNKQRDSWFAGFTGDMLAVVWLGHDDNTPTQYTGASGALPIWTQLIKSSSRRPLLPLASENIHYQWIDIITGRQSDASCFNAIELPFIKDFDAQNILQKRSSCSSP